MAANEEAAAQFVRIVFPFMVGYFLTGAVIAVLFHLSLFHLEGEFRTPGERLLDAFIGLARGLLFFVAWPFVLFFDRDALYRIKMYWRWLDPKQRTQDEELRVYLKERERRREAREQFCAEEVVEKRRDREMAAGNERVRRLRTLHADNPELDRIWLLCGFGTTPAGVREIVRLYPDHMLPDEVVERVKQEIMVRREQRCVRCRAEMTPASLTLPELTYLRVTEPGGTKPVVEGWALQGEYRIAFPDCPKCGAVQPEVRADLTSFGRAGEIVQAVQSGLEVSDGASRSELTPDLRVGKGRRLDRAEKGLGAAVGVFGIIALAVLLASLAWCIWVYTLPFHRGR